MDADGVTHHLLPIDPSSTQQASTPSTAPEHSKERPATEQQQ
jgi:hypothetical protein